ncbi:protein-L-isoaspartate(D-aspartate) O-methyltransferase [Planomicrobium sp. CPCC 101079]|uniref:protein-L-isoaspartate(D-aspartate) O-methyltransferase n=1 Tax=Planomicrobium sp. CPCC 101079 TaxID=2599618 RepID=UPI0011B5D487|nr:protein-L-isoaspartate(D-aspartate) O-methyltransferase [Planomicrobium sp. CPCC 101079]TWT16028.1 protein-L-isoaspartate(D-aspartate) O-methyltransferase [Planomicrobium sp. CPCC 101079]
MNSRRKEITAYFEQLDRSFFMDTHKEFAGLDEALPIGYEQTISQPSLVLEMTIALDLQPDSKVLEIGTGSGFQTALLAEFSMAVYTVERIEALHVRAKERLAEAGFANIHFQLADGSLGWRENAPYDRIMVTAAASEVPKELIDQLGNGGKMIIPVGSPMVQELQLISKNSNGELSSKVLNKVVFVRLKGKYE